MTRTSIPNFEIVGPWREGLLDQFLSVGWKWYSPFGLYGMAAQISSAAPEIVDPVVRRFLGFGSRWHRRTVLSPNRHLWILVWRLLGKAEAAERQLSWLKADRDEHWIDVWKYPSRFHRLILRVFFGCKIDPKPGPEPWEDD